MLAIGSLRLFSGQAIDPRQQQRHQPANQPRLTAGRKLPATIDLLAHQPHKAFTAMYAVGLGFVGLAQLRQTLTPLHQQARTLFPAAAMLKAVERRLRLGGQSHCSSSSA